MKLLREKTEEEILEEQTKEAEKKAQKELEKEIDRKVNKALKKQQRKRSGNHYVITFAIALVIVLGVFLFMNGSKEPPHKSIYGKQPLLGQHSAEITELIVTETRKENKLIVLEKDMACKDHVDDALWDLDLFKKTQEITFYGTADYTVDLSSITTDSITVNPEENTITVKIPHSDLNKVTVDFEKTEFSEIERGLLGWGSIKLKPEEQNALEQTMVKTMEKEANHKEYLDEADKQAQKVLSSMLASTIYQLDDIDAKVQIEFIN